MSFEKMQRSSGFRIPSDQIGMARNSGGQTVIRIPAQVATILNGRATAYLGQDDDAGLLKLVCDSAGALKTTHYKGDRSHYINMGKTYRPNTSEKHRMATVGFSTDSDSITIRTPDWF